MKKLIMLGLAVLGLMTSCSNDELVTVSPANSSKEIAFSTHVDKVTRSSAYDITNNTIQNFSVYGYTRTNDDDEWTKIFDDEGVQHKKGGSWYYVNTQYWTIGNSYIFNAITNHWLHWKFTPSADDGYTKGTLEYSNGNASSEYDLVYAYNADITNAQLNGDSFAPVELNFKHLLSRVKFRFEVVDGDKDEDNPGNARYCISNVRLIGAYDNAQIEVDGNKIKNENEWDEIPWTGFSTDDVIIGGLSFGKMYLNASDGKELNKCTYFYDESESSKSESYYYIDYENCWIGETDHYYVIPVDEADQSGYKVTFNVNLILATGDSTDEHTTGEMIEATGYADLSKVAIDMHKGYSYVYTIKINAAKLKFTDPNQTHDPIVFDNITVDTWKIDDSTNDFLNSSQSTDATAE
jgi:hypothetical protein